MKRSLQNLGSVKVKTNNHEVCRNPWKRGCQNTDIVLSVRYKNELLPICRSCWFRIAKSKREW